MGNDRLAQRAEVMRTTQGFIGTLTWMRSRPLLTAIEVTWRWLFGVPALLLAYRELGAVLAAVPWRATGIANLSINQLLTDPMSASTMIANAATLLAPGFYAVVAWMAPLLLVVWAVVSGVGRTLVLRRMDVTLEPRPLTLIVLQLLRLVPLCAAMAAWWFGLQALARWSILQPIAAGGEPQMMVYVGGAIALTLGLFVLSAAVGWVFSVAPLLAMIHNRGAVQSLRDAVALRDLRASLVEINLVLGIVKIALLILAMVFSATPLPFQSITTDEFLLWWTLGVTVVYILASDFFHVARLAGYLRLWRATR